ncbi:SNF2 family N-terminal domain-containing protein [Phlebopus sp. FC_14]|nr:SNF2 family N-terminal domain-containing protein [Phlebopus sp. FC_14]
MSADGDVESNRKAALDGLRFRKTARRDTSEISSPQPATSHTSALPFNAPPAQSRHASIQPCYYPPSTSSNGTVLVPNSSPIVPDKIHHDYSSHHPQTSYNKSPLAGSSHYSLWSQSGPPPPLDPLSASSGFVNGSGPVYASFTRKFGGGGRRLSDVEGHAEDGPPRKRMNRGGPSDTQPQSDAHLPTSPCIQRPGQRRRVNVSLGGLSTSSEDSMPDIRQSLEPLAAGRPRIVRGQRPDSSEPTESKETMQNKDGFTKFRLSHIESDVPTVQAAWDQAGGDIKKATELLHDPSWKPQTVTGDPKQRPAVFDASAEIGRVVEVDEATKAVRAAMKEKAKKSSIYANRDVLDTTQVTPVATTSVPMVTSPTSPSIPLVLPKRRRRVNKVLMSDSEKSDSDDERSRFKHSSANDQERTTLSYFNTAKADNLQELTGCSQEQAETIISRRPFLSVDDLNIKLGQGKKKAGPAGISPRIFEDCQRVLGGYGAVDSVLEQCERIGASLRAAIASWSTDDVAGKGKAKEDASRGSILDETDEGSLSLKSIKLVKNPSKDYFEKQPAMLPEGVTLKDYQLLGVNWLYLLYRKEYSCILADEMGLGKTIQVISFFAHMKERGNVGPHLVVVPSSTLENWCREFARFAPSISVQTYYAGKEERPALRQTLADTQRCLSKNGTGWEVLVTTYNLAQGDEKDRKFFRRIEWDSIVFDEGHVLKNFQSQRYQALLKFEARWRLLLTGTPLQNNLQELVSLLNFILPNLLGETMDSLRAIFKTKGDAKLTLLSQERISRAKKMMTPFVLRRRKDQVLTDLPLKTERIEWCEMTELQRSIYNDTLRRSRKTILETDGTTSSTSGTSTPNNNGKLTKKKTKASRPKDKYAENSSNVLMDLRKAASHPMLFRKLYTDQLLTSITKVLLKEPDFKKRGAVFQYVKEDMEVMTDSELQFFCQGYKSTRKYLQDEECYLNAGKVTVLLRLLEEYAAEERKVLIFSQFTQILDILQAVLKLRNIKYLMLTGSTAVDVRQSLVDEFTEDESIPVFLLSTKAGGMGINLTAASVVIMFDQDFNPHNDRQAQDRAYRIGQKRDVDVVKLITRATIEEDMLRLGETKLALDEAVAGEGEEGDGEKGESVQEKEMKMSLMNVLRKQLEGQETRTSETPL